MSWVLLIFVDAVILACFGWLVWLSVLVAKDANRRGMKGWVWGVLVFCGFWVTLLIYRHFRGPIVKDDAE